MKKLLICLTLLCCSLLVFSACAAGRDNDHDNYGGDPMEFERFSLSTSGTTTESHVYEGYRTESGVHLAYYTSTSWWDNTVSDYVESRHVIRAIDGDDALYQTLCALLGDCRINEWAGFRGANPPDVLDGSSMSFQATLPDGSVITASGSNNFPPNYRRFSDALSDLLLTEQITGTAFTDGTYELTLPESWVGVVRTRFSEGMVTFSVDASDGKDVTFFILDNTGYGYTSEDYPGRVAVGRLVSDDDIRFITARDLYAISTYAQKVSPEALALWESYESDKAAILESLRGVNGYTLYPEDGTVLYEAQAQELADNARSLWLYLHFAGEDAPGRAHRLCGAAGGEKRGRGFRLYGLPLLGQIGIIFPDGFIRKKESTVTGAFLFCVVANGCGVSGSRSAAPVPAPAYGRGKRRSTHTGTACCGGPAARGTARRE